MRGRKKKHEKINAILVTREKRKKEIQEIIRIIRILDIRSYYFQLISLDYGYEQ